MKIKIEDEIIGGVHDLQILSWENVIEFSQEPPGSLPVDSLSVPIVLYVPHIVFYDPSIVLYSLR